MLARLVPLALALSLATTGCSVTFGTALSALTTDPAKPDPHKVPPSTKAFYLGFGFGAVIDAALMCLAADLGASE